MIGDGVFHPLGRSLASSPSLSLFPLVPTSPVPPPCLYTFSPLRVSPRDASLGRRYPKRNLSFIKGYIECLSDAGIKEGSVDVVISNCVVNLSPNKAAVINEVYKALAPGGEFYFSDVYCDR